MKLIIFSLAAIASLTSCNTMIGVGRDTRILGETMEKTAEKGVPGEGGGGAYDVNPSGGAPVY